LGNWVKIGVPIIIVSLIISITVASSVSAQGKYSIPSWVKGVAGFWAEDKITDNDFGEGLAFLIDNGIISVPLIQELQDENKKLKSQITSLANENSNLKQQVTELTQQSKSTPTYAPPQTTKQYADLNYPKITKRYDLSVALEKFKELLAFDVSLTSSQRSELASRSVSQSEFAIVVAFTGEFILTVAEGNFEFTQINGRIMTVIPFDCSHNFEYLYSIVAQKEVELGKISLYVFKNGVTIDFEQSDKPFGMALAVGQCDEPTVVR